MTKMTYKREQCKRFSPQSGRKVTFCLAVTEILATFEAK